MTIEALRQNFTEAVLVAKSGFSEFSVNVLAENRGTIDLAKQSNPFLEIEVELGSGWQADISSNPRHRIAGLLVLTVKAREGTGSAQVNRLLDFIYPKLQRRRIGTALTEVASFPKPFSASGLYAKSVVIPFHADAFY
jgi:hypothetical protein